MTQHYPSDPSLSARTESGRPTPPRRPHRRLSAGFCGGRAEYWGGSPTLVRLACLALALLPGPMWVVYVVAWILMPEPE